MPRYEDFKHLQGAVQLEYLPTAKSRKWRKGPVRLVYSQFAFDDAVTIAKQDGWSAWRYVRF